MSDVRTKKYETAAALLKAVDKYFDKISGMVDVTEVVMLLDDDGHPVIGKKGPVYVQQKVYDKKGNVRQRLQYYVPPSLAALCLDIGISQVTWAAYSDDDDLGPVCAYAKLRVEAYLTEQVNLRDRPQGVIFNLQNNYGWRERSEHTAKIQDETDGISLIDKINLIREAARSISGSEIDTGTTLDESCSREVNAEQTFESIPDGDAD